MEGDFGTVCSLMGLLVTVIFCLFSFRSERETYQSLRSLAEAKSTLVSVLPGAPDSNHDGRLVCVNGTVVAEQEALSDPLFAISASQALRLERRAEVYQWRERVSEVSSSNFGSVGGMGRNYGGRSTRKQTVTTYEKGWFLRHVDSQTFKRPHDHQNIPPAVESLTVTATPIKVGPYQLAPELVERLQPWHQVSLDGVPVPDGYTRSGEYFTNSETLDPPKIGDQRISFQRVNSNMLVTIVAQQASPDLLRTWRARAGDCIGWVLPGLRTPSEIMEEKTRAATDGLGTGRKWFFFFLALGLALFLGPHYPKLRQLPIIGIKIQKLGAFMGTGMVAMLGAGLLWVTTTVSAKVTATLIPKSSP